MKAHFCYLTQLYSFYVPAVCLPALAYTYIHHGLQPQAMCIQYTRALRKRTPQCSQHRARFSAAPKPHKKSPELGRGRSTLPGLPAPCSGRSSRSNPGVKWSIFRAALLCFSCQWLRAAAVFRHCWDVWTMLPCLQLCILCSIGTVMTTAKDCYGLPFTV